MKIPSLVEERRALALAALSFYMVVYLLGALVLPPPWRPLMWSLVGCYGLAFFALASEWFWGRWFASGIGWSGVVSALMSLGAGMSAAVVVMGATHAIVVVCLLGRDVALRYELRLDVQERLKLDEEGLRRLGKTVTRTASALPALLVLALAPRTGEQATGVVALVLGAAALFALVRGRSWGLASIAGVGIAAAATGFSAVTGLATETAILVPPMLAGPGAATVALAAIAVAPFAFPIVRALKRD